MKKKPTVKKDVWHCDLTMLIARIFIAALFAMSLIGKLTGFSGQVGYIGSSGYPFPEILLVFAIALELIGVLSLVLGYKMKVGAFALILFTAVATLMFHIGAGQEIFFLKNLAIIGGLLVLSMKHPGKFAIGN